LEEFIDEKNHPQHNFVRVYYFLKVHDMAVHLVMVEIINFTTVQANCNDKEI